VKVDALNTPLYAFKSRRISNYTFSCKLLISDVSSFIVLVSKARTHSGGCCKSKRARVQRMELETSIFSVDKAFGRLLAFLGPNDDQECSLRGAGVVVFRGRGGNSLGTQKRAHTFRSNNDFIYIISSVLSLSLRS